MFENEILKKRVVLEIGAEVGIVENHSLELVSVERGHSTQNSVESDVAVRDVVSSIGSGRVSRTGSSSSRLRRRNMEETSSSLGELGLTEIRDCQRDAELFRHQLEMLASTLFFLLAGSCVDHAW